MSGYSLLDRALHRLAFAHPSVQLALAELGRPARPKSGGVPPDRPVFVTSLPRAGTTALLEALDHLPAVATHRYRDMPFVLAPALWGRLSGRFRRAQTSQERAHGDGIAITVDSPEAFEEVAWRAFWPAKYGPDGISLWGSSDRSEEAFDFLSAHMAEIVSVRSAEKPFASRYVSKNNANIARIPLLREMFPDAHIVVPIRDPVSQAMSLLHQHVNFERIHREDRFALSYMRDIGHFEFGALHRPIRFPNCAELMDGSTPTELDYWLAYWITAYEHVLAHRDEVTIVNSESVFGAPGRIATLLETLGFDDHPDPAAHLRRPRAYAEKLPADPSLVERAQGVFAQLRSLSI
jgi:hypothetical protein